MLGGKRMTIKCETARIIKQIWSDENPNKAVLAALRNSTNILNKKATIVWPLMLAAMNEKELSKNGKQTVAETAIYSALHCYAIYQQSDDNRLVYGSSEKSGKDFFVALSNLRRDADMRQALDRRVQTILGNSNTVSVINTIYHLTEILKANNNNNRLLIDFARLSQDLYYFQFGNTSARMVCLKWGQQYYRVIKEEEKKENSYE